MVTLCALKAWNIQDPSVHSLKKTSWMNTCQKKGYFVKLKRRFVISMTPFLYGRGIFFSVCFVFMSFQSLA